MTHRDDHPSARWVRAFLGDSLVVESHDQVLVWEDELPVPRYLFPADHVDRGALRPTSPPDRLGYHHPNAEVAEWFDVVAGGRTVPHGAWIRADHPHLIGVTWEEGAFDRWMEEDQVVVEHPHDPFVHIDAYPSSRHVVVAVDGLVLADSRAPTLLWETGLPVRYYLPRDDVDLDLLTPTNTRSVCPYKGFATDYWSVPGVHDVAWSYPDPFFPYRNIAGRIAFLDERVDVTVDGVRQARPVPKRWAARSRLA